MTSGEARQPSSQPPVQRLARLLRHEVGDLLQSVYSTVAILQERLPIELEQERRLVQDLKNRAELCKFELDAAVELASPANLDPSAVNVAALLDGAVARARRRYGNLPIQVEREANVQVEADVRGLTGVLNFLMLAICQSAQNQVEVILTRTDGAVCCTLQRDGFPVSAEQLSWLEHPFATTQNAFLGLGLALARRIVEPTGGVVTAANRATGGFAVRISFPVKDA